MADQPAPAAGGKKILGMPRNVAFAVGAGLLGVGALLLWRHYEASKAQAGQGQGQGGGGPHIGSFTEILMDWQGHQPHGHGKGTGGGKHKHPHPAGQHYETITVDRAQTFGQLAQYYHWDKNTISQVEEMNKQQGGGELTLSTELHPGETILRPISKLD